MIENPDEMDYEYWMMGEFPDIGPCIPGIDPRTTDEKGGDDDELEIPDRSQSVQNSDEMSRQHENNLDLDESGTKDPKHNKDSGVQRKNSGRDPQGLDSEDIDRSGWYL